jgi:hypothetical protein
MLVLPEYLEIATKGVMQLAQVLAVLKQPAEKLDLLALLLAAASVRQPAALTAEPLMYMMCQVQAPSGKAML